MSSDFDNRQNSERPETGKKPGPKKWRGAVAPSEFSDPLVWTAWLYYEEKLTQEQIAEIIGVSRASIANTLQEARDKGVVTISVAPRHLHSVRLARDIVAKYGISECLVIPNDKGKNSVHDRVGRAASRLLADRLQTNDVVGVSWGRTILALSEDMPARHLPSVSVVQVTGSTISRYGFSAELCASNIANRLQARCVYLHAPGIVSDRAVKAMLMKEPTLMEQFDIASSCNRIIFGVGNVTSSSTAFNSGFMKEADAEPYVHAGAVAMLAGRFLDIAGRPMLGELDDRLIGLTIADIAQIPDRICAAAGQEKVLAIRALLLGDLVTSLVTDETTARHLLSLPLLDG